VLNLPEAATNYANDIDLLMATASQRTRQTERWLGKLVRRLHAIVYREVPPRCARKDSTSARAGCIATAWRSALRRTVPARVLRTPQTAIITEQAAAYGRDSFVAAAYNSVARPFDPTGERISQADTATVRTTADLPLPPTGAATNSRAVSAWVTDALSAVPHESEARMQTSCGGQ